MFKDKIHRFHTKVGYKDLDMYSVVYHPKYFEFADTARNQAFQDFGYPVEEQLKDKTGFTIAGMENVSFKRPLFMGEEITVFTEVVEVSTRSCKVLHWISLGSDTHDIDLANKLVRAIFHATYTLVFVSLEEVGGYPLNGENIKKMKAIPFNGKVKATLGY